VRLDGLCPEVVRFAPEAPPADLLAWDEAADPPAAAFLLARAGGVTEDFPLPIGVFRRVAAPAYERSMHGQIAAEGERIGVGDLDGALGGGETWTVS